MRSILKHPSLPDPHYHEQYQPLPFASCASVEVSNRVHFPPTPTLTSTFITHSSAVYDRTPAEVLPNTCALPGRHEREFVETACPRRMRRPYPWDAEGPQTSYFQHRGSAIESSGLFTSVSPSAPRCLTISPHIRVSVDVPRSESDDSDVLRTPPEPSLPGPPIAVRFGGDVMLPSLPTQQEIESALLFLPHAPTMPLKKKGTRRTHNQGRVHTKGSRQESADGRIRSEFGVPTLDFEGCLGGF